MKEEKEILEKSLLSHDEIEEEGIEEHYAKMYKDLPPDVVKMLISTHPLYGEKVEPTKEKIKETVKETTKEFVKEPVKEIIKEPSKETIKKSETKDISDKKVKAKKIEKDEDYDYEKDEDYEEDNEKEFLYSLFSKSDGEESNKGSKKYVLIGILTTILFVCIIGMAVNITQNAKNKSVIETLEKDKLKLTRELENNQVTKDVFSDENANLKKEIESLKTQLASGSTTPEGETPTTDTSKENPQVNDSKENNKVEQTTTSNVTKKENTYTVEKGDGLWKISTKIYGSGKYVDDIAKANNLKSDSTLTPGTTLVLPDIKGGK